jgi:cobalt transporter subunit CbtB
MMVTRLGARPLTRHRCIPTILTAKSVRLGLSMINILATSAKTFSGAAAALIPAVLAILLGAFIVYGVGFASPMAIHNAAHDTRHSFAFPCH